MVHSRRVLAGVVVLIGLLVSACSHSSNTADVSGVAFGAARTNPDTSWSPKWDTAPDKNRKAKTALSPAVSFADQGFHGSPIPQSETENEQERQARKLFVESFRSERQCNGITLKLKDPKEADFSLQVFDGIDGRTGRWEYVLYRVDTLGLVQSGEGTGGSNDTARIICSAIRDTAFTQGGTVE